jgi:AAA+ superfamily predicted ATPase
MPPRIQPRKWLVRLSEFYDPVKYPNQGCVLILTGHTDDLMYWSDTQPGLSLTQVLLEQFRSSVDAFASYRYAGRNGNLQWEFNTMLNDTATTVATPESPAPSSASNVLGDLIESVRTDEMEWSQNNRGKSNRVCDPQEAIRDVHNLLESRRGRAVVIFEDVFWQIEDDRVLGLLMEWPRLCRTNYHLVVFALRRDDLRWIGTCFEPKTKGVRYLEVDGPTPDEVKALLIRNSLVHNKEFFEWELLDEIADRLAKVYAEPGEGYSTLFTELIPNTLRTPGSMMNAEWLKTLPTVGQKAQEVRLDDLVLKPSEREYFRYLLEAWKDPQKIREKEKRLGKLDIPNRILLYGPPGTGKTTIAKMIATETGRTFFSVTAADFTSEYRGGPLKAVQRHFAEWRRHKPCVVFWDEVEATAANRQDMQHSDNPINQILTELEGPGGRDEEILIICATNLYEKLDPAFLRRFPEQLLIGYPDDDGYVRLVKKYFNVNLFEPSLSVDEVARMFHNHSPSDVESCARACKLELARRDGEYITREIISRWLAAHSPDPRVIEYWKARAAEYEKKLTMFQQ